MASPSKLSEAKSEQKTTSDENAQVEGRKRSFLERHSGLVVGLLGLLTATLSLVTAWGKTVASERDDLTSSRGDLQDQVDDLQETNEQLATDLEAAQNDQEEQTDSDNPGSATTSIYLTSLEPVDSLSRFLTEGPVKIDGDEYPQGLSGPAGPPGALWADEYSLSRSYTALTGQAGLDDDTVSTDPALLEIKVDGVIVKSEMLEYGKSIPIDIDLTDKSRLSIGIKTTNYTTVALGDLKLAT